MGTVDLALGLAAAGTLGFSLLASRRQHDANCLALLQIAVWSICAMMDAFLSPPESKLANPALDLGLGVWVAFLWARHREPWKLAFLILLAVQGAMHVVYQRDYLSHSVAWRYALGLNITFLAQLLCVAWPGLTNVASDLSRVLRRHPDHAGGEGVR